MNLLVSDWIAIYAAILSTILAIVKVVGFIRGYYRVDVLSTTTSSKSEGNEIYIYNLCDRPLMLVYWKLEWHYGIWPFHKVENISTPEFDMSAGRRIDEYGSHTLPFKGDNYFQTGKPKSEGKKLYIRLYFAGKNAPKLVKVQ
ncbi:hypothetical protein [Aeromonas salmonicida]|uniref:hypothetical protein n=1 Tax=Aeromonas salmonicida TaxID=645 RepID=UPI00259EF46B|nr:hypothetical protein [Aeromonas salmonicida]MDM5128633.1 hypothetical protein [Aeromonas salmonicida]